AGRRPGRGGRAAAQRRPAGPVLPGRHARPGGGAHAPPGRCRCRPGGVRHAARPDRLRRYPAPRVGSAAGSARGAGGGLMGERKGHVGPEDDGQRDEVTTDGSRPRWRSRLLKVVIGLLASVLVLALVVVIAFQVSYWPTTLVLRNLPAFNGDD